MHLQQCHTKFTSKVHNFNFARGLVKNISILLICSDITHPCDKCTSIIGSHDIKSLSIFYKSIFITVCI